MRTFGILAALAALVLFPIGSSAQPDVGHVGMYFNPQGTIPAANVPIFTTMHTYVVVVVADDLSGFELSVESSPEILVTGAAAYDPPGLCIGPGCGPVDWSLVGLQCLPGLQAQWLVDIQWMLIAAVTDRTMCVGPFDPSGPVSSIQASSPIYRNCADETLLLEPATSPYGPTFNGCALINPTVVASPATTWSHVKGTFSN